jgi:hypothetical protein
MKTFKIIYQWFLQNAPILNTLLFVVIIFQLHSYFQIPFIDKTIIPFVYLVTAFFIIQTFRATQRRNLIDIGTYIADKYTEEIKIIVKKLSEPSKDKIVFQNGRDRVFITTNQIPGLYSQINSAIHLILTNEAYKTYKVRIRDKDSTLLTDYEILLSTLIIDFSNVAYLFNNLNHNAKKFKDIYENLLIFKLSLTKEHINLLIDELEKYLSDYYKICEDIIKEENFINTDIIIKILWRESNLIGRLGAITTQNVFGKFYGPNFINNYNRIKEIKRLLAI